MPRDDVPPAEDERDFDGDGIPDDADAFPDDSSETIDSDGDGVGDNADAFPNDRDENFDFDGDGVGDNADAFPDDSSETIDSDGDGVGDNADAFPNDPDENFDFDGDGVGDNADAFPGDSSETIDRDVDGVGDNADAFPNDPDENFDFDGDGVGDNADAFPNDPEETTDSDGDGVGDAEVAAAEVAAAAEAAAAEAAAAEAAAAEVAAAEEAAAAEVAAAEEAAAAEVAAAEAAAAEAAAASEAAANANNVPVAADDTTALTGNEDTTSAVLNTTLLSNDKDADGDTLKITKIGGETLTPGTAQTINVTNGTVNVDSAGNIRFTPTANHVGAVSFAYTVSDDKGGTNSATVSGSIQAVNDTPVAVDDTTALNGNQNNTSAVLNTTLLSNDFDAEDDTLKITKIGGETLTQGTAQKIAVTNGTVNVDAAGNITFAPTANHVGAVSFAYTVSDGTGAQSSATVSGTITNANGTPVAADDTTALNGNEDTTSAVLNTMLLSNDKDADGDTLTITNIGGTTLTPGTAQTINVTNGTVNVDSAGNITFTPAANYAGTVSFAYTVSDGKGGTNSAAVSGTITNVNDTPVAQDDTTALNGNEDTTSAVLNTTLLSNDTDADGDTLTITNIGGAPLTPGTAQKIPVTNGTVNVDSAGNIRFTPTANHVGAVSFAYTVSDGTGAQSSATVSGTITNVNDTPVAADDTTALNGNQNTASAVLNTTLLSNDTDADGDTLTITNIGGTTLTPGTAQTIAVTNGTVNVDSAGNITFKPTANYAGAVSFAYTVSDGTGAQSSATVSGTITNASGIPVAADDTTALNGNEDTTSAVLNTTLLSNDTDADGDTLKITNIGGTTLTPGTAQTIAVTNGTVNVDSAGNITFTPAANHVGAVSFAYTVSDGTGAQSSAAVSGTITNVNDIPVAQDDTTALNGNEDTTSAVLNTTLLSNDMDVDSFVFGGDTLTITNIGGTTLTPGTAQTINVTNGTVNVDSAGNITFTPAANHVGAVSFAYTVSDGTDAQSSATVSGTITNVNDTPVAADDTTALNGNEDTTSAVLNTTLLSNDFDAEDDTLKITKIGGETLTPGTAQTIAVTNGTVNVDSAGNIRFTPTANHVGAVSFAYTVSDGTGAQSSATVSGTITNVNDTPVAADDTTALNGNQNTASAVLNTTLLSNDTDADGDTLTITMIGGTELTPGTARSINVTNGTVNVDSVGNITFKPTANHVGAVSFAYTVSDGKGGTNSATVSGSIQAVNDTPVAADDTTALNGNEDTTSAVLNTTLLSNDKDADGDTLTITMIGGTELTPGTAQTINVTNGTVNVDSVGNIRFTPTANHVGAVSFAYTVSDGKGGTNSAAVSGSIQAVNDTPVAADDTTALNGNEDTTSAVLNTTLLSNDEDADGDTLTITKIGGTELTPGTAQTINVTNGTVNVDSAGNIRFTPTANHVGAVSFAYTVSDGTGAHELGGCVGQYPGCQRYTGCRRRFDRAEWQ